MKIGCILAFMAQTKIKGTKWGQGRRGKSKRCEAHFEHSRKQARKSGKAISVPCMRYKKKRIVSFQPETRHPCPELKMTFVPLSGWSGLDLDRSFTDV